MIIELDKYILIPAILVFWFVIPLSLFFWLTQFKLIENSPDKLEFAIRPILRLTLASILGGIAVALTTFLLFNNFSVTLTCNKPGELTNVQCNLDTEGIVFKHQHQFIPDLLSARLNYIDAKKEEDNSIAEPILITSQAEINLGGLLGSSDIDWVNKIVNDVNQFVNNSQDKLEIIKDDSSMIVSLIWDVSIFTILSLLVVALSPYQYCSFDSESQQFSLEQKSLFRKKVLSQTSLREIDRVELESRSGEESRVYTVWLHLRSGEKLSLTGLANNYQYHSSLAKSIRKFLKANKQNNKDN